jgi:hypothetical protein
MAVVGGTVNGYRHTQIGYFLLIVYGAAILVLGTMTVTAAFHPILLAGLILLVIAWRTFATLTVSISQQTLQIQYGLRIFRKHYQLNEIASCRPVKNPWYYGWGLRYTPRGWLYAVSGLGAVELKTKDGKTFRVGTDEPDVLAGALVEALGDSSD